MPEWTLSRVFDTVAALDPDRPMTVCGERRTTFGESAEWSRRLAGFLVGKGFGVHQEREELDGWECGQDRVALIMYNDQYIDTMIGCLKARAVPFNVNHNYSAHEIRELLEYMRPRGIIFHSSLSELVAEALPDSAEVLVSIGAEAVTDPRLSHAISLEDALASAPADFQPDTSPDDLIMVCTGGTTGRPKGVQWRQGDVYVATMGGADHASEAALGETMKDPSQAWFAVSPLMHAAGIWTTFSAVLSGQPVVLHDNREKFQARHILEIAEREKVAMITIVGDAYAKPLVDELNERKYDLSSLFAIATGGAATNPVYKHALFEHLPHITIIDGYGSSETGGMGYGHSQRGADKPDTFELKPGGSVVSADRTRFLEPGEDEIGWMAQTGRIPLGYFDAREATERTFPVIAGQRAVIPGDRATFGDNGAVKMLGRDALVVNTGGEKVFVEEVEEVLRAHPEIADALVIGRPSERWGQEVVALVAAHPGAVLAVDGLRELCAQKLANFKTPKAFIVVDEVRRLGNGKADYRWAKAEVTSPQSL